MFFFNSVLLLLFLFIDSF